MDITCLSKYRDEILSFCGKTDEDMKEYVRILREWLMKQPHLPSDLLQDELLEIHLLKNKFSAEKTKTKIENYCTMKNSPNNRYLFENYSHVPSEETHFNIPLPNLTDDFYRIIVSEICDEEKYDMKKDFTNTLVLREFLSRYDYSVGEIQIIDIRQCSSTFVSKFKVKVVVDAVPIILKGFSARVKEVHIISNTGGAMVNIAKPFLPSKLASKIFLHENIEAVAKLFPAKCLPKDYGGELKSLQEFRVDLDEIYATNREKLAQYVNTKATGNYKQEDNDPDVMRGTFKKLNID